MSSLSVSGIFRTCPRPSRPADSGWDFLAMMVLMLLAMFQLILCPWFWRNPAVRKVWIDSCQYSTKSSSRSLLSNTSSRNSSSIARAARGILVNLVFMFVNGNDLDGCIFLLKMVEGLKVCQKSGSLKPTNHVQRKVRPVNIQWTSREHPMNIPRIP